MKIEKWKKENRRKVRVYIIEYLELVVVCSHFPDPGRGTRVFFNAIKTITIKPKILLVALLYI